MRVLAPGVASQTHGRPSPRVADRGERAPARAAPRREQLRPLPPPPLSRLAAAAAAALLGLGAVTGAPSPAWSAATPPSPSTTTTAKPLPPWSPSDPPPTALPPLRSFTPPAVQRATVPNGLRIVYVPDKETPTVRGVLIMRGGGRAAPEGRVGLAGLAAAVQRSGGSLLHPSSAFDDACDALAATIEAGAAPDATSIGFEGLAPDLPAIVGLVGELVTQPALPPAKLALAQASLVDALRHRDDAPGGLPGREAAKLVYGPASVHARTPTIEGVVGIQSADLRAWLGEWQRPDAAVLAIVGDCGSLGAVTDAVKASALGSVWSAPAGTQPPPLPDTPLAPRSAWAGRTFLIDRPGLAQATVLLVEPGVLMTDPDTPSLDVLAAALNSFGGRLFDGLRSRAGLAYSVSAGWDTGRPDHPGLFVAGGSTAAPAEFLYKLSAALGGLGRSSGGSSSSGGPLSPEEVARARDTSINGFVFNYASPDAAASRAASLALFGLPPDYLATYRAGLGAVSPASVAAAAGRHLHPADAVAVVVGDARTVRPTLEALGRGPVLDLVPSPVSTAKAKATAKAAAVAGGEVDVQ